MTIYILGRNFTFSFSAATILAHTLSSIGTDQWNTRSPKVLNWPSIYFTCLPISVSCRPMLRESKSIKMNPLCEWNWALPWTWPGSQILLTDPLAQLIFNIKNNRKHLLHRNPLIETFCHKLRDPWDKMLFDWWDLFIHNLKWIN